jgi:hypothetical protein
MTFRPERFTLEELVPPDVFQARAAAAWELLDPRALMTLDALRKQFGPTVVNNWRTGGSFKESGFRASDTSTGARYSQHKYGRAFDCKFRETTAQDAQSYILEHPGQFEFLTTLEDAAITKTWLHFDVRLNATDGVRIVRP